MKLMDSRCPSTYIQIYFKHLIMRSRFKILSDLYKLKALIKELCDENDRLNKSIDNKDRKIKRLQKYYHELQAENEKLSKELESHSQ